ncbi:(2E,6E)-farnesyl diphosphate synthase [compost metagenome]
MTPSFDTVLAGTEALIEGLRAPDSMQEILEYPLHKARAHVFRDPEWPVIQLPLLLSRNFDVSPDIAVGLAMASLLLYGFADITDDAQDGDLRGDWGWERAVNAGNALAFLAHRTLLELPLESLVQATLTHALTSAGLAMTFGQENDLRATFPRVPSVEEYFQTIQRKTGGSAAFFAKAAAIASRQSPGLIETLHRIGEHLGTYHQLLSDLDAFTQAESSDLRNRKVTLPLIYTLNQSSEESKNLAQLLSNGTKSEDLEQILMQSGSRAYCQMKAQLIRRQALALLMDSPLSPETQEAVSRQFRMRSGVQAFDL